MWIVVVLRFYPYPISKKRLRDVHAWAGKQLHVSATAALFPLCRGRNFIDSREPIMTSLCANYVINTVLGARVMRP